MARTKKKKIKPPDLDPKPRAVETPAVPPFSDVGFQSQKVNETSPEKLLEFERLLGVYGVYTTDNPQPVSSDPNHDTLPGYVASQHIDYSDIINEIHRAFRTKPKARVYLSTDQLNLVDNTETKVLLDTESYDIGNNFASNRFDSPVNGGGYYLIGGQVSFKNLAADKACAALIKVDGSSVCISRGFSGTATNPSIKIFDIVYVAQNSYVELWAWHNDGSNTPDLTSGVAETFMAIHLLSV